MKHIKKKVKHGDSMRLLPIALVFFIFLILFLLFHSVGSSLFFTNKERLNIVVYGRNPALFSIDLQNDVNYVVNFYPDMTIDVPGGYAKYRMGALGKLVSLEKKPEMYSKTFSLGTSSFVDYYFYPSTNEIYYGSEEDTPVVFPNVREIIQMKSNASLIDRLYLAYLFFKENEKQFKHLRSLTPSFFRKEYQGYFYSRVYRHEQKNIGIVYNKNYKTAEMLGALLEGVGIRVSDYQAKTKVEKNCVVMEDSEQFSNTAKDIASFFHCSLKRGDTDVYDIIFSLGNVEKDWEV